MKYLFHERNTLASGTATATNIVPSAAVYRTDRATKAGGGAVALVGDYTGQDDATFDVEIVGSTSGTPRVSEPVFSGTGNGTLSDLAVSSAVAAQEFTITLEDLGTLTRKAYAPFQSATLFARTPGDNGNDITLSISGAGLVNTPTQYATQEEIRAGQNEYVGEHWNFGTPVLNIDGTIPQNAPRIRFGFDPQVYRAYRKYVSGRYVYGFSPAPVRDVERGTPVYTVTGSRTITITDGITTDTLPGIVTVYDCLRAIRDNSTLVEVEGVIVNDQLPGGQGVTELAFWTTPYLVGLKRDGTQYVESADIGVELGAQVPTERLTIRCRDTRNPGAETWTVRGEVSGELANAITGVQYNDSGYSFLIPVPASPESADRGSILVRFVRPGWDGASPLPLFEAFRPVIGAEARTGTWSFEYRHRPTTLCEEPGTMIGGPSAGCLGLTPDEGGDPVSQASALRRMQELSAYVREHVQSNTASPPLRASDSVDQDIAFINTAAAILRQGLVEIIAGPSLVPPVREGSKAYAVDDIVTDGAGFRYYASTAGTTGSGAPTWSTTTGATTSDGTVTWTCLGKVALGIWDDAFARLKVDADVLKNISMEEFFSPKLRSWEASEAYAEDDLVHPPSGSRLSTLLFKCTTAGTTGSAAPDWTTATAIGDTVSDGSVVWTLMAGDSVALDSVFGQGNPIDAAYFQRYESEMTEARAAAGLTPNFEFAGVNGDGCWQDYPEEAYWWQYIGSEPYAPMFTGIYYHSALLSDIGSQTVARSTKEFGFGPKIGCPELLQPGDQIIVRITGIGGPTTYEQGDTIELDCVRAVPLEFGGGQIGDDKLTFSVIGSVDGRLDDYELDLTAPGPYSDEGLEFKITPGQIEFGLGARWTFAVEAAQFKWRKNDGSWSSPADVPVSPVSLSDGLSASFVPGLAPSWVSGDRWTFKAEAVNGPGRALTMSDGALAWTGSTAITMTPPTPAIAGVYIGDHAIPSDATITLQGSDDNFSTTPLSVSIPWRARDIWHPIDASYAKYRLTINKGGRISYLWLGAAPFECELRTGAAELGRLTKRIRLPNATQRRGDGVLVEHEGLPRSVADQFVDLLAGACESSARRVAIVPRDAHPESGIVRIAAESIELTDVHGFQPVDGERSLIAVSLELEPIQ
jgi:hypothetical protein